ncbi:yeats2, putative [Ixodes scapularis]|uniref:Yeats2, putative n=1 Tax=Ixodes scapularis TaxID=6945 RepID=B7Q607_IXOSC|nr:yeats2, putative [Ixodes scapularis]|eukprot:XP_002411856.1 yeats2, putative [Ixodes scapularis]
MWDSQKRPVDQDPDYESIPLHAQQKRIKLHEQDAKEATVRKIEQIVKSRFSEEISARESELDTINQPASNCAREKEEEATAVGRAPRLKNKMRVIVGNVSKYISSEKRDPTDHATHKWMVYVRCPPGEPEIASVVRKVRFFLHPSYRPNDLVEVTEAPFQLVRKGWGEFPLRVQLHFRERWNKPVDVIHSLKVGGGVSSMNRLHVT